MLSHISTELVLQVYDHLNYTDILSLSLACKRFSNLLLPSRKLSTYFAAADREFGPLSDAIQVVVLQPQAPHIDQNPPLSYSLLRSLIHIGRVAAKFEAVYPLLKWREHFLDRRSLTALETWKLRRAVYRSWRYSSAFHTPAFPRTARMLGSSFEKRMTLLRFPTQDLLELEDMRRIFDQFISTFILHHDAEDFSEKEYVHIRKQSLSPLDGLFHTFVIPQHHKHKAFLDWGDEIARYYLVQDLLKLDPGQLVRLKENPSFANDFIQNLGEWFHNNGETLSQTLNMVLLARGDEGLLEGLEHGDHGIVGKIFSASRC
jgi:hypothetical protein